MIRGTGSSRLVLAGHVPGQDEFSPMKARAGRHEPIVKLNQSCHKV